MAERRHGCLHESARSGAKNIKVKLASLGVSSKDLFEKEELARALANAWGEKLKGTVTLPLRQLVGMPGNPRAGYVVVTLDVGEAGFVDFLIDSGATTALISFLRSGLDPSSESTDSMPARSASRFETRCWPCRALSYLLVLRVRFANNP